MKFAVSLGLVALTLAISVKDLVYLVSFKLNQQQIAERWCVNWNKPELNCQGTCYLNDVIQHSKEQEDSSKLLEKMGVVKDLLVRCFSSLSISTSIHLRAKAVLTPSCAVLFSQHRPYPPYQPPQG